MKLKTSKGTVFGVDWAWAPVGPSGEMMLQLHDDRPLAEIASDFDGCDSFHRESQDEGDMDFTGYSVLTGITRPSYATDPTAVRLTLSRPERS